VPGLTKFGFGVSVGSGVDVGTGVFVGANVATSAGFSVETGGSVDSAFATDVAFVIDVGVDGLKIAIGTLHKHNNRNIPAHPIANFPASFCFVNHVENF
jgi:hypothetical protein